MLRDTDELAQLLRRHPGCGGMGSHVIGEKGTGLAGTQAAGAGKGVDPAPASLASELSSGHSCVTWGKSLLHSGLNVFTCNWSLIIPTSEECQDEMMGVKTLSTRPHPASFHYPRCPGAVGFSDLRTPGSNSQEEQANPGPRPWTRHSWDLVRGGPWAVSSAQMRGQQGDHRPGRGVLRQRPGQGTVGRVGNHRAPRSPGMR